MEDAIVWLVLNAEKPLAWVGTLLMLGVGWLVKTLITSATVRRYVERAVFEVKSAVLEVHQTYVSELRKAREDGMLTPQEKRIARDKAIGVARANIGGKGLGRLARVLGIGQDTIDRWLGTQVEAAVAESKAPAVPPAGAARAPSPLPPV